MNAKKWIAMLLVAVFCLSFAACDTQKEPQEANKEENKVYQVGISQLTQHPALDAATKGFRQALIDKLGEDKVKFDEQNGSGETTTLTTIANNFVSKKVDLIMANGTAALETCANATTEIPILGTSITEYGVALHLEDFNGTVGGNISGTSDLAPLADQAQMILDFFPEAKKVGLLYCSAEPNSAYQVAAVKEYLEGKGVTCTDYSFSDANDVSLIAEKAAADSDVIYVPTDNTAANSAEIINNVVLPTKTPIIAGEEGICSGCGVATLSISYYEIGYKTGEMAAKILTGEANISEMPIEYDPNPVKKYNKTICDELQITVPADYVAIDGTAD